MIHTNPTNSNSRKTVLVIMGSVRSGRRCPAIASWVVDIGRATTGLNHELVDLVDWPLPSHDEPGIPALVAAIIPRFIAEGRLSLRDTMERWWPEVAPAWIATGVVGGSEFRDNRRPHDVPVPSVRILFRLSNGSALGAMPC
jgi:hypothetical protein